MIENKQWTTPPQLSYFVLGWVGQQTVYFLLTTLTFSRITWIRKYKSHFVDLDLTMVNYFARFSHSGNIFLNFVQGRTRWSDLLKA